MQAFYDHKKRLTDINIAYNTLDAIGQEAESQSVVNHLIKFIHYSRVISHLDLSGLNLAHLSEQMIQPIRDSKSLCIVHLSNN